MFPVQSFGPFNITSCNIIFFLTRFSYILILTLIALQQFFRYLYVFKWRLVTELNEIFWAKFLTLLIYFLSSMSAFASVFSDQHKYTVDFHLCIGQEPSWDLTRGPQFEFRFKDPIHIFSFVMFFIIFALAIQILVYSHKNTILKILKSGLEGVKLQALADCLKLNPTSSSGHDHSTAILDLYVDAGPYLAMAIFAVGILIYSTELRESMDGSSFSVGPGRALTYLSKVLLSAVTTVILPTVFILNNIKMRQCIWKRLKQASIFRWARVSFVQEGLQMVST